MGNAVALGLRERRAVARGCRAYRARHGLTRAEMARVMGVSLRTVVAVETGTGGLAPGTLRAYRRVMAAQDATDALARTEPAEAVTAADPRAVDCPIYQHITGGRK